MATKQTLDTKLAVIEVDIKYIKAELRDVKRLEYLLLGLFVTFFALLVTAFIGLVIKG